MNQMLETLSQLTATVGAGDILNAFLRYLFPVLALIILGRCARSLLLFHKEPEIWAWLAAPNGDRLPVTHWETLLGRAKNCDVVLDYPTISRSHAVLTRYDDGSWTISDVGSKGGIQVNGQTTSMEVVSFGDKISLGGVEFTLVPITKEQEVIQASVRTRAGDVIRPAFTLILLSLFQILAALNLALHDTEAASTITTGFAVLMAMEWVYFIFMRILRRTGFEVETIAFFLCTLGLAVIASDTPAEMTKQLFCIGAGLVVFLFLCWSLRDLERAKKFRYLAAVGGIGLLLINLVFGVEQYGAKNWIYIAGMSFQPSELVKLCFIFVGASTLQRIMTKRNMFLFIAYSAMVCGCLVLMSDFGTALIFFVAFLVIAYMRSGSFATIALIVSATGFGGVLALRFKPYILNRFSAWGHVWEDALNTGYQQTRSMMCIASGGLFGLGAGRGWLKYVAASDTDLVFAFVGEEWGAAHGHLHDSGRGVSRGLCGQIGQRGQKQLLHHRRLRRGSHSPHSDHAQRLRHRGSSPPHGVTFPFVSNGGSSMIACWGLLAFIKAADTRQNASVAVRLPSKRNLESKEESA